MQDHSYIPYERLSPEHVHCLCFFFLPGLGGDGDTRLSFCARTRLKPTRLDGNGDLGGGDEESSISERRVGRYMKGDLNDQSYSVTRHSASMVVF